MAGEPASDPAVEYEATLAAIAERFGLLKSHEIDGGINDTLRDMGEAMGVDTGHVFRVYHDGRLMEHTHGWNLERAPQELTSIRDTETAVFFPWIAHQLSLRKAVAIDSVSALKREAPSEHMMYQRLGAKALMFVPMSVRGELTGFFCFVSWTREIDWDARAIHFVRVVGAILGETIERRHFEKAQSQFEGILQGTSAFVAVIGKETRHLHYVNRGGLRMLGIDDENDAETGLLHLDEIIPEPHLGLLLREILPRVDKEGTWTGDSVVKTRQGAEVAVLQTISQLSQGEESEPCYSTVMRDISPQKEMEEALRRENEFTQALLDGSGALFVVLDPDGGIVRFNAAAESATGYRQSDLMGRRPWDIFVPPEEAKTVKSVFNLLASGDKPSRTESTIMAKDRTRHVISWSNTVLQDDEGRVEYIVQSGIDVTDSKRLEKEVLDIAEHEQARFGQDLHDGLGQHLAGIEFMSQALEQKLAADDPDSAGRVREIKDLIRNAITQTRDLARGLSPVVLQSKGLQAALQDLANGVEKRTGLSCVLESDDDISVTDEQAAIHLYRIAQEAVANAMKHGMATAITISLRNAGSQLVLRIEDNGRGFADDFKVGKGMGLRGMNYRAGIIGGSLEIVKRHGATAIICSVQLTPLHRRPNAQTELPEILRE